MKRCLLVLLGVSLYGSDIIDVQEVVRRATSAMRADWAAAPSFAFVQRDISTSKGITARKTHQVLIISGSDYYMPMATDDEALPADQQRHLPADQQRQELQKLSQEVARRSQETPQEAQRRSERYRKVREQNGVLLNEFA